MLRESLAATMTTQTHVYPAFLKLGGRKAVVVGGGPVAALKLGALIAAGARVLVIAPDVGAEIERASVEIAHRAFRPDDLDDAWLVVAAATPEVNRTVAAAAESRHVFVNAVDDPPNASLYLGGVVRRPGITLAFSTDGQAPALAGLLREAFDAVLPAADLEQWMREAARQRQQWRIDGVPMTKRRPALLDALNRLYERGPKIGE